MGVEGTHGECVSKIRTCVTVKFMATIIARSSKFRKMNATSDTDVHIPYNTTNDRHNKKNGEVLPSMGLPQLLRRSQLRRRTKRS